MNIKPALLFALILSTGLANAMHLKGKVLDATTGEELIAVTISVAGTGKGTFSDATGNFALSLDGKSILRFFYLGYEEEVLELSLSSDSNIVVHMKPNAVQIKEAIVSANRTDIRVPAPSVHSLSPEQWKLRPGFAGESDVIQALFSMPGIKKAGDANGGMMVRGGSTDQNMVLLDGILVYQCGHIISFYSPFQTEIMRSATLYKGAIPAAFGGRLSSVLVMQTREEGLDSMQSEIGLGLLTAKVYLNAPLLNNKMRLQVSARRSLPDVLWPLAKSSFPAKFHDGQLKLGYQVNPLGRLTLKLYHSADGLKTDGAEIARYKETGKGLLPSMRFASSLKEQHAGIRYEHNGKVKGRFVVYYSSLTTGNRLSWPENELSIRSGIRDFGLSGELNWKQGKRHTLQAGFNAVHHRFEIMEVKSSGELGQLIPSKNAERRNLGEGAVFIADDIVFNPRWRMEAGLRMSCLLVAKTPQFFPEPRVALYYKPNSWLSLNAGLHRGTQFLQRLSSASAALPTDTWYPLLTGMKPQSVWMSQLGARAEKGKWLVQLEGYYKAMNGLSEYREGAMPFVQDNLWTEVVRGKGRAYGMDVQTSYTIHDIQIQAAYSLSWSTRQFNDLNEGRVFYDRFDRRHDFNVSVSGRLSKCWQFSGAFYMSTGARYTPKIAQFVVPGVPEPSPILLPVFGERNSYRLSNTHRLDIGFTYSRKIGNAQWQVQAGAYNVYNQLQSFRLETVERNGKLIVREIGLFGMMPSLGLNVKF